LDATSGSISARKNVKDKLDKKEDFIKNVDYEDPDASIEKLHS
jgi:hypothetical protein